MRLLASEQAERITWSVKAWNRMAFVTVTIPEQEDNPRVISGRWSDFMRELRRLIPGLRVIRVLQMHPGGHGWHVHALFDRYVPHSILLHQAELAGLGRMDFQMVSRERRQNCVQYVSRYVTRDLRKRDPRFKRTRLLTAAGNIRSAVKWWRRVCDLSIEGHASKLRASLISVLHTYGLRFEKWTPMEQILGGAPEEALAEWRGLNPGLAY